jgi:hydrogenase maturation factor HypF (carbamoyltransferase family)
MAFKGDKFSLCKGCSDEYVTQGNKKYFHVAKLYYTLKLI